MFVPLFFIILYKNFFREIELLMYLFSSHVFVRLHDGSITLEPGQDNHKIPFVEHDFCIPEILFVKLVAFIKEFVTDYPKYHMYLHFKKFYYFQTPKPRVSGSRTVTNYLI